MINEALLSWYQALQLVALGPCLFMVFFMIVAARRFSAVFVPILYFSSLACSFFLPLSGLLLPNNATMHGALLMGESLTPSLSFLLIVQFIYGRIPSWPYWTILAVPFIGGSSLIYATLIADGELCISHNICADPNVIKELYEIFSSSFTFLFTVVILRRAVFAMPEQKDPKQIHKYALVIALIVLNLALLAIDLIQLNGELSTERTLIAETIVRIGFIYLVLTSVFRAFDRSFEIAYERVPHIKPQAPTNRDSELAGKIRALFNERKLYREMGLSREKMAAELAIPEHLLSRVINMCFSQNFNTLVNQYRIDEAKRRLVQENVQITVIAFEVGFNSIPSFNRVFKQMVGLSPSEYRHKHAVKS